MMTTAKSRHWRAVKARADQGVRPFIDVATGVTRLAQYPLAASRADPRPGRLRRQRPGGALPHPSVLATGPGVTVVARDSRDPGAILRNPVLTGLIDLGPTGLRGPGLGAAFPHGGLG